MTQIPRDDAEMSLVRLLTTVLREEAGFPEQDACRIARSTLLRFSESGHGGRYMYVGTAAPKRDLVRQRVVTEFTGDNIPELMRAHGVSRATVYRWLKSAPRRDE